MSLAKEIIDDNKFEGLSDLEKSRLLYIELAKRVSFSTKFQNGNFSTMADMINTHVNIDTFNETEVNCVMWAQLYSQLLDKVGIKNYVVGNGHKHVEFTIDGKRLIADATYGDYHDLARIHNGDDTAHFGLSIYQNSIYKVSNSIKYDQDFDNELKGIDNKVGYYDDKYKKTKELAEMVSLIKDKYLDINEIVPGKGSDVNKKLQLLFAKVGAVDEGFYEAKDYIRNLERALLTDEEYSKVKSCELKRTNKDESVDIVQIISVKDNDNYNYYVLAPGKSIKSICEEDIIKLSLIGYGKDEESKIQGLSFPRKFVPGKVDSGFKYIIKNTKKSLAISSNEFLKEYDNIPHGKAK